MWSVLPFLAINRQIRDFGQWHGDRKIGLAIDRQSPKFRDFESKKVAISANFWENWPYWRFQNCQSSKSGNFSEFSAIIRELAYRPKTKIIFLSLIKCFVWKKIDYLFFEATKKYNSTKNIFLKVIFFLKIDSTFDFSKC